MSRDMRDPQAMGDAFARLREKFPEASAIQIADGLVEVVIENYRSPVDPVEQYGDPRAKEWRP